MRTNHIQTPDSKVHGANMGPTLVLSAPGGPHDRPINLLTGTVKYNRRTIVGGGRYLTNEVEGFSKTQTMFS